MSPREAPPVEVLLRRLSESAARVRWQPTEEDVVDEVCEALGRLGFAVRMVGVTEVRAAPLEGIAQEAVSRIGVHRRTEHLREGGANVGAAFAATSTAAGEAGRWGEALLIPVVVHEQLHGLVAVGAAAFTAEETAALELFVWQVAAALEHQVLVAQIVRRNQELVLLDRLAQESAARDLPQVLEIAAQTVAHLTEAEAVALYLGGPYDSRWTLAASSGAPAADFEPTQDPEALARAGETSPVTGSVWRRCGATSTHPITLRGRVAGVMVIGRAAATPLDLETRALVSTATAQLAVHVDNAWLMSDRVQRERLVALGELAAVVAHEVRNPLGAIFNAVSSLRRLLPPSPDGEMLLGVVGEEASRLNRIVADLLDFARAPQPQLEDGDVASLVDEAVQVACATAEPGRVEVVRAAAEPLPALSFDRRLLRQALVNVALNAVQAMPRGGRLSVRTLGPADGQPAVRIEIEDTGAGVPEPLRERIFDPFFTTKASGTGLGLAVVKRIVEDHRGQVAVRSVVGQGTVVAISLPLPVRSEAPGGAGR